MTSPHPARAALLLALALASLLLPPTLATAQAPLWPPLDAAPDLDKDSRGDAAVIIGVEDYVFIPDVPGALQNALDWWRYLQARGVPLAHIALLRNADATAEAITDALTLARGQVQPGARLWVVFIGHGAPAPDGSDGLLVGVDAQQTARSLQARAITRQQLISLASGPDHDAVLVLDACFSGRDRAGAALVPGLQPLVLVQGASPDSQRAVVMSAGAGDEFAGPLPLWPRPAFSYLLLGALRGWGDADGDGAVTAEEAVGYSRGALQALLRDRRQTPEVSGGLKARPLATQAREPGPDLSAVVAALYPPPPLPILPPPALIPAAIDGQVIEPPPSQTPNKSRGLSWSRVFIGAGFPQDLSYLNRDVNLYGGTTLSLQRRQATGDAYVSPPSDVTLTLQSATTAEAALVAGVDAAWGGDGFALLVDVEVGWINVDAAATLTAEEDTGTSATSSYQAGEAIAAVLDDLVWMDFSTEAQYRYPIGSALGLYMQGGVGVRLSWLLLAPPAQVSEGSVYLGSDVNMDFISLNVPFRVGVDYHLASDLSLDLRYSLLVLSPSVMHVIQLGFGLPF